MKHNLLKFLSLCSLLLIIGCYPYADDNNVSDYDSVYTDYDSEFNFTKTYTYILPTGVVKVDGNTRPSDIPEYIDKAYSDAVLNATRENLNEMGWTELTESSPEDPEIVISAIGFDQTFLFYDYGYWWNYGWGWYYPYPPVYVSGYKTGSIVINMTDPNDLNEENEVPVVWLGAFNGILQGNKSSVLSRIDRNVNQAFKQAPFNN